MKLEPDSGPVETRPETSAADPSEQPVYIWLSGTVRGKGRARFSRKSGTAYTPVQTQNYEAALRWVAQMSMRGRKLFAGSVRVAIVARFDIPKSYTKKARIAALANLSKPTKKPDWDNIAKLTDALNGVVWRDDAQITDATFAKRWSIEPGLQIEVSNA